MRSNLNESEAVDTAAKQAETDFLDIVERLAEGAWNLTMDAATAIADAAGTSPTVVLGLFVLVVILGRLLA